MNFLEHEIDKNKKLLKEMELHPDPNQMKSTRIALEIEIKGYTDLLEALQERRPVLGHFVSAGIARAMGAIQALYQDFILVSADLADECLKLYEVASDMGMPDYMCEVFTIPAAAVKAGQLPPPVVSTSATAGACRTWMYHMKTFAEYFGAPTLDIDTPIGYNEESIKYLAGQLSELVKFVEKNVPQFKYDEDKHKEIIKANRGWVNYNLKEYELRKNIPMPISNLEAAVLPLHFDPSLYGDKETVLGFWRTRVEEIEERVAKGVKKEEKLRMLWLNTIPAYMDVFSIFDRLGVSLVGMWLPPMGMFNGWRASWGDEKEFGRKLTPLEEEARYMLAEDNYKSREWAENVIKMCKDWSIDAIVYYQNRGCHHIGGLAQMVAEKVDRELGVPTLIPKGTIYDPGVLPPEELESTLTAFVETVLARKERDR
jgi:benzoyl-CoA reductase/2-hydroxyglutaryl-CoA dehydratase subunit BcrC/BadD/HgdB